ncbi:MAG: hydrogenase iron-sulfur subunit [Thermodesulfovibrionales bacterium]|nr:hydrogenase iron-sulfur subunit [Thermodesulfovibrionales bacterium]
MNAKPNIKVFVCSCNGIIENVLSVQDLTGGVQDAGLEALSHPFLCSQEGIRYINENTDADTKVLIAACSPFHKQSEFSNLRTNKFLIHRIDIRDQCAFVHKNKPDEAFKKAQTLIKMGVEKVRFSNSIDQFSSDITKTIAVIGGGIAGINTAIFANDAGLKALIIEKSPYLGGKVKELFTYFPRMCPPACGLELFFNRLRHNRISALTLTELISLEGNPGNFELTYKRYPRYIDENKCTVCGLCIQECPNQAIYLPNHLCYPSIPLLDRQSCLNECMRCSEICPTNAINLNENESFDKLNAGAIVVATGWDSFKPDKLSEYGYKVIDRVFTNLEFEKKIKELTDKKTTVAFIQCVGSRDDKNLPYCSDVCCMVSIKQALSLKTLNHDNEVYIFYNDIRTPGEYELFYKRARKEGIHFIKGIPSEVKETTNGEINLSVYDTVLNKRIDIKADLVVLATGMMVSDGTLNLKQVLDKNLNFNENGFVVSHLQCYPQDSLREGIYSAGACRGPMDVASSINSASSSVISALSFINKKINQYRDFPNINKEKCDVCKRCIEECPHNAYLFDTKGFPYADENKCRRCGICMGSCPVGAISIGSLNIEQLSSMIDVIDVGIFGDDEPLVLAFLCQNDAYRAVDDISKYGGNYEPNILTIPIPCAGAVNGLIVAKAISSGIDGVIVGGCEDAQCHFSKGSSLAQERIKSIRDKLTEMFLEPERVSFFHIPRDGSNIFLNQTKNFLRVLRDMGRNPLRII